MKLPWQSWSRALAYQYETLWWIAVVLVVLGGLATVWGYTRPLTQQAEQALSYRLTGELSYRAQGPPELFPQGQVLPPAPLYTRLHREVTFRFYGHVQAPELSRFQGRVRLRILIQDDFGWRFVLEEQEARWRGTTWEVELPLDLRRVEDRIRLHQLKFPRRTRYTLVVEVDLQAQGEVLGQSVRHQEQATWRFQRVDEGLYTLKLASGLQELRPSWEGQILTRKTLPNVISLAAWFIPVATWRQVSMWVLATGLVLWAGLQGWLTWARTHQPQDYYLAQLGRDAIPVQAGPWLWSHQRYMPVERLEALVELAHRYQEVILYAVQGNRHLFLVWLPDVVYYVQTQDPEMHLETSREEKEGEHASGTTDANAA